MRFLVALLLVIAGPLTALAQIPTIMVAGVPAKPPAPLQTIASITPTSCSYAQGSASGTSVCSLAVMMSPLMPAFSGICSGSTAQFSVSPSCTITLAENDLCSSAPCNYSLPVTATPSNSTISSYSQTITITSSSGPSAPAAALAGCSTSAVGVNGQHGGPSSGSCFNVLALNMDFTTSAAVSGFSYGPLFNAQDTTQWLQCVGQTPANLLAEASTGNGSTVSEDAPCDRFSIASDQGFSTLKPTITTADENSNGVGSWILGMCCGNAGQVGHALPTNFYTEIRYRISLPPSQFPNYEGSIVMDYWSYTGGHYNPCNEMDFIETYSYINEGTLGSGGGSNNCNSSYEGHSWDNAGANPAVYHTYGERMTGDGNGNMAFCYYLDGTQVDIGTAGNSKVNNCEIPDPANAYNYQTAMALLLQVGTQNSVANGGVAIPFDIYYSVQWFRVWDCANWTAAFYQTGSNGAGGGACNGPNLATNP